MISTAEFDVDYKNITTKMKDQAINDLDAYLPNIRPIGPVDYVFIGMEPSLGRWARNAEEARLKVETGFCNFTSSIEDFILHYCIQNYLCRHEERYHITDLSKGAMLGNKAAIDRIGRYDRWYDLLVAEMDIVAPRAAVFALGRAVKQQLAYRHFSKSVTKVIHYSPLAARARMAGIVGYEHVFSDFQKGMTLDSILATAEVVLKAAVPNILRDETLKRLAMKKQLTSFQQMLIFNYKLAFESFKAP